jgi:LacI family transcriptional regulator
MRRKVDAAIKDLGYRPRISARGMRGSTYTFGIEIPDFTNQFMATIIAGATAQLSGTEYQLVVAPADPGHPEGYRAIEALADRQVDGVVAISPMVSSDWLEEMATRVPLVMLGRHDHSVNYDTVVGDDDTGTRLVMDHLLALGHRNIAHLTLTEPITRCQPGTPHEIRLTAYENAMVEAGLAESVRIVRTDPGQEPAHAAAKSLLGDGDRPTAIYAAHDELALGVLHAAAELNLGSDDVSVVGYDDTAIAGHPRMSLTSVNQSGAEMGARAVSLLLERINGRTTPSNMTIPPRLIVRGSTGRADNGDSSHQRATY